MDIWYSALKLIVRFYNRLCVDQLDVRGFDGVPVGPKIFAANHPNTVNAILLPLIFPERQYFMVSAGAFNAPLWGWFLKGSRQIPVTPGRGKQALKAAAEIIARGDSIVILPEGRTTPLNSKRKAGTGAVRLALDTMAPIIPVGFYMPPRFIKTLRLGKRQSDHGYVQFGGPCCVNIGKPWFPGFQSAKTTTGPLIRAWTDQLMANIRSLAAEAASWSLS